MRGGTSGDEKGKIETNKKVERMINLNHVNPFDGQESVIHSTLL